MQSFVHPCIYKIKKQPCKKDIKTDNVILTSWRIRPVVLYRLCEAIYLPQPFHPHTGNRLRRRRQPASLCRTRCKVTGIDRAASRIHQAETFFAASGYKGEFTTTDFFNFSSASRYQLILIHDVIEHISNKEEFFRCLSPLLAKGGIIFWGFPSWQMPFGGHQQICHNRFVSSLPFIHLCPGIFYRFLLRCFHETPSCIEELSDIKRCRMTIDTFEQLAEKYGYEITDRQLWFINPHYQQKFHLRPRKLYPVLAQLKYIRNYFSTSCFYITRHRELHD